MVKHETLPTDRKNKLLAVASMTLEDARAELARVSRLCESRYGLNRFRRRALTAKDKTQAAQLRRLRAMLCEQIKKLEMETLTDAPRQ